MISCLREWLPPSGSSAGWPCLPLADRLPAGNATRWYATGRAALYQALRPLAGRTGAIALLPCYLAAGVIDPIRALGFTLRFYPTGPGLLPDLAALGDAVAGDPAAAVVVVLHPMGRVLDLGPLPGLCRSRGALLVEDCAQALFCSDPAGRPAGSGGDLALFSFTKYLGCLDGAAMVYRTAALPPPPQPRARPWSTRLAGAWYGAHLRLDRAMHRSPEAAGRLLAASGFCYDRFYAIASRDFRPLAPSPVSARQLQPLDWDALIARRKRNRSAVYSGLGRARLSLVYPDDQPGWVPMAVPALVEGGSREALVAAAMARNVFLASLTDRWDFLPPGGGFAHERHYLDRHVLIPVHEHLDDPAMHRLLDVLNAL